MKMTKFEIKYVKTPEEFKALYDGSAFTLEGLDLDTLPDFQKWLEKECELKESVTIHIIKGKEMNCQYKLRGFNAYKDDLNIVCVNLSYIKNPEKLAISRFRVGGRWFDDIVDNNSLKNKDV